ncbi:MAG: 50S ribosomal protein L4 [Actinobacteria bacterium]|nr:50S ribosomal protein L4 [Actinomycetota bacterium]
MANLNVIDLEGKEKGKIKIDDSIVNQEINEDIIYQEVRRYLAASRSGTHKTKERSEVSGGGRKPWRQKGTGNARAGSNRSPIWRHGGIVFGPKPRDYSFKLNKKVIRKSRLIAISEKFKDGKIIVIEDLDFAEPKTKEASSILDNLKIYGSRVLLVMEKANSNAEKSFRNIPGVAIVSSKGLSTYDILISDYLMFTKNSLTIFLEVLGNARS